MSDDIRVNGASHSWGSIVVDVDGEKLIGYTAITFGDKISSVMGHGMGRSQSPNRRSRGKYEVDQTKLTGYISAIQHLRERVAALNGQQGGDPNSYGQAEFGIVITYTEPNEAPMTVELRACRLEGNSANHAEGPELMLDEVVIQPMAIYRNGLALFDTKEGAPV